MCEKLTRYWGMGIRKHYCYGEGMLQILKMSLQVGIFHGPESCGDAISKWNGAPQVPTTIQLYLCHYRLVFSVRHSSFGHLSLAPSLSLCIYRYAYLAISLFLSVSLLCFVFLLLLVLSLSLSISLTLSQWDLPQKDYCPYFFSKRGWWKQNSMLDCDATD